MTGSSVTRSKMQQPPARPNSVRVIAEAVGYFRKRERFTQEHLARLAGIDRTYIGKVEREVLSPTTAKIDRILYALDVSWVEFGAIVDLIHKGRKPESFGDSW